MAQIAQTHWGQQWLRSLRSVDEHNRLGRGMELARQRAVEDLRVDDGGEVTAQVRSPGGGSYRVRLTLKPFTPAQREALLAEVARRPEWLDLLLNGQLPAGLPDVLARGGGRDPARVELFPDWHSLRLGCSCPDATVPCKHLAATLYQLAADIDEDPTLLFSLRGLNLARELTKVSRTDGLAPETLSKLQVREQANAATEEDYNEPYVCAGAAVATIVAEKRALGRRPKAAPPASSTPASAAPEELSNFSLSSFPTFLPRFAFLLPARPPFFPHANLAELYLAYLRTAADFWSTRDGDDDADDAEPSHEVEDAPPALPSYGLPAVPAYRVRDIRLRLDAVGGFAEAHLLDADEQPLHTFTKEVALLSYLERLTARAADATPAAHTAVAQAFRLARGLVSASAVVPRLLHLTGEDYRVRWEPATQDPAVAEAVRQLAAHPGLPHAVR